MKTNDDLKLKLHLELNDRQYCTLSYCLVACGQAFARENRDELLADVGKILMVISAQVYEQMPEENRKLLKDALDGIKGMNWDDWLQKKQSHHHN